MFQITVLFLYLSAGIAIALTRWPATANRLQSLVVIAALAGLTAIVLHTRLLWYGLGINEGLSLSLGNIASFVGLQLALIAAIGAGEQTLRGLSGGLLILAGICALLTDSGSDAATLQTMSWQMRAHVLVSLFAYGLLSVGAIVSLFALLQEWRLRNARLSPINHLFAPLETTERLLFDITFNGFMVLLLAVVSGLAFVENLFAQHLVHKTVLSLVALLIFGILLLGRRLYGWRGKRAIYLYLWGFIVLGLAYFGSRFILESVLGRSWG